MRPLFRGLAVLAAVLLSACANADDHAVIESFYADLLSAPNAADIEARTAKVLVEDWESIPQPRGGPGAAGFVKTLRIFGGVVPDLTWEPQEILEVGGGRYVVRGKATGTPVKTFLGVEPTGAGFEIQSIDIHTVENGRIVRSYHVEDWVRATFQVKGKH